MSIAGTEDNEFFICEFQKMSLKMFSEFQKLYFDFEVFLIDYFLIKND